jgi:Methyltransferase domain
VRKWQQKAIAQKIISYLPFSHQINSLFQKYYTKGVTLTDAYFDDRLTFAAEHLVAFEKHAPGKPLESALELGTGWYPVVPVSLFLRGAHAIYTSDIAAHCSRNNILTTLRMFKRYRESGKLERFVNVRADRWSELSRLLDQEAALTKEELLKNLRIHYIVADARSLALPARSISLITSNGVLQAICPAILREILAELRRVAAAGGVMSHCIDLSDQFARLDKSITNYNFLQYSRRQWQLIDNPIAPQNRLRISHYRTMYRELGIPITEEFSRVESMEDLARVKVHPEFHGIPPAELAVTRSLLVSKM